MALSPCANCNETTETNSSKALVAGSVVICPLCLGGVKTVKLVLKRDSEDAPFKYEQYIPLEMLHRNFGQ